MTKNKKYIFILLTTLVLFIAFEYFKPKELDWSITYSRYDKNPFGAYLIFERLPDLFPGKAILNSNQTIYEREELLSSDENILIISEDFQPSKEDSDRLLELVKNGKTAVIFANNFGSYISDTLKIKTSDYYLNKKVKEFPDSLQLRFLNPVFKNEKHKIKLEYVSAYFKSLDSKSTEVIVVNHHNYPQIIKANFGKGSFVLGTIPLALTNYHLLDKNNHILISNIFSYLENKDLFWTEYYQMGRMEPTTPFRYILRTESLKYAYQFTILTLLLFLLFESKRRQRVIPIVTQPENSSIEFTETVARLYFHRRDNKNIALKKIRYLKDYIKSQFFLSGDFNDPEFCQKLSLKSGKKEETLRELFDLIMNIHLLYQIDDESLLKLNKLTEWFYKK
jgi:hypothetical protein